MLFMDIVGSTALAERLDPEALRQIMDRYFAACLAAITDHGGVVEKFIGDAVLAVFGAIVAHEDDAVRAVRAAARSLAGWRMSARTSRQPPGAAGGPVRDLLGRGRGDHHRRR